MISNETALAALKSPVRHISARVEVYNGSTLAATYTANDNLSKIEIERAGDSTKFYGYGICQKLHLELIDTNREIEISTANHIKVMFSANDEWADCFPAFYVTQVRRDENTNALTITAYDALYSAVKYTVAELHIEAYTILEFARVCAAKIGLNEAVINTIAYNSFYLDYPTGANFEGTETLREALDAVSEATQTVYYINASNQLVFRMLLRDADAVYAITKDDYFTLGSGENKRLAKICNTTELGDSVYASISESGSTQYMRDNPFLELREDIGDLIGVAISFIGGLTINQFECNWRGNYLLEIGDKIALETKDGNTAISYLLDDTLTYNGAFQQKTRWKYTNEETETEDNPSSLGEVLKQTYAKVDKANKQIELMASDVSSTKDNVASMLINTESITASVQRIEESTQQAVENTNESIAELSAKVSQTITADELSIAVKKELANGVEKVETETGFTFDSEGLMVSKSGSEMATQITEDGMQVFKNDTAVLTANNIGVDAVNLHATTYLIIGTNSRFEDYETNRTGCFWIGA